MVQGPLAEVSPSPSRTSFVPVQPASEGPAGLRVATLPVTGHPTPALDHGGCRRPRRPPAQPGPDRPVPGPGPGRAHHLGGVQRDTDMTAIEKRRTVLVVEDDADLLGRLQATLELPGYEVERAGDGLAAPHEVRRATPDLEILDLNMPRMGGEDFLYAWRSGFETPGVPVIVITAQSSALRAQDLG